MRNDKLTAVRTPRTRKRIKEETMKPNVKKQRVVKRW
jgi:hypothetical protein